MAHRMKRLAAKPSPAVTASLLAFAGRELTLDEFVSSRWPEADRGKMSRVGRSGLATGAQARRVGASVLAGLVRYGWARRRFTGSGSSSRVLWCLTRHGSNAARAAGRESAKNTRARATGEEGFKAGLLAAADMHLKRAEAARSMAASIGAGAVAMPADIAAALAAKNAEEAAQDEHDAQAILAMRPPADIAAAAAAADDAMARSEKSLCDAVIARAKSARARARIAEREASLSRSTAAPPDPSEVRRAIDAGGSWLLVGSAGGGGPAAVISRDPAVVAAGGWQMYALIDAGGSVSCPSRWRGDGSRRSGG